MKDTRRWGVYVVVVLLVCLAAFFFSQQGTIVPDKSLDETSLDAKFSDLQKQLFQDTFLNELLRLRKVQFSSDRNNVTLFAFQGEVAAGEDNVLGFLSSEPSEREMNRRFANLFDNEEKGYVIDVGANLGFYTLMAAAFGHKVIAFEPQPHCQMWIKAATYLNGFVDQITLIPSMVGMNTSFTAEFDPRTGCWGTWPISAGGHLAGEKQPPVTITTQRLDDVVNDLIPKDAPIHLLKIDVEGVEALVLRSARKLIESGRVRNFIIEFNGYRYSFYKLRRSLVELEMNFLYDAGYVAQCNVFDAVLPLERAHFLLWMQAQLGFPPGFFNCWLYHNPK